MTKLGCAFQNASSKERFILRKPVKPFVTEYKSRKAPKPSARIDENMMHDEVPPRDINADLHEEDGDAQYEQALRAADSVFGKSPKAAAPESTETTPTVVPEADKRTVLSDLSYRDPLEERLAAAAAVKRGRKPGSTNKPKIKPPEAATTVQAAPVTTPAFVVQLASPTRRMVRRVPRIGFMKQLAEKRATKPGERWKLKLRKS